MHPELRHFLAHLAGAVTMGLVPVVLVAFLSMPLSLNRHPGEQAVATVGAPSAHMT
jgi:hypothetical protein